jgi:excisionase family DNA binding protein
MEPWDWRGGRHLRSEEIAMDKVERLLIKPLDAAAMLSVSRSKIYEMIGQGVIPSVKISGLIRVPRAALERIAENAIKAASDSDAPC